MRGRLDAYASIWPVLTLRAGYLAQSQCLPSKKPFLSRNTPGGAPAFLPFRQIYLKANLSQYIISEITALRYVIDGYWLPHCEIRASVASDHASAVPASES